MSKNSSDAAYMAVKQRQAEIDAAAPSSQAVIPAPSSEISEAIALHVGTSFAVPSLRPDPEEFRRLLAWRTGLLPTRATSGQALPNYAGWAIEIPGQDEDDEVSIDDEQLIAALELLCEREEGGRKCAAEIVLQHKPDENSGGKPRYKRYIALSRASLYVVAQGVPSNAQMSASVENRWGVAYGWPKDGKSALSFQVFVKEIMDAGYFLPLQCSFHGSMTSYVLTMLRTQYKVLAFADKSRQAILGESAPMLPFYAYDLPTTVSAGTRTFKSGKKPGDSQECYVPVPLVGAQVDAAYLQIHAIPELYASLLEDENRIERAVAWSVEVSKKILENKDETSESQADNGDNGDSDGIKVPF